MELNELRSIDIDSLPYEIKMEIIDLLDKRDKAIKYSKVDQFVPYPFQEKFYAASKDCRFRFLCAANRIGKSFSEAAELSFHLTGKYPDWWKGHRFNYPIKAWAVGITGESTRTVLQTELFGTSSGKDEEAIGTGAIPRDNIVFDSIERDGHFIKSCQIRHFDENGDPDGSSYLSFKSTQQGEHVLMGATMDYIWLDW